MKKRKRLRQWLPVDDSTTPHNQSQASFIFPEEKFKKEESSEKGDEKITAIEIIADCQIYSEHAIWLCENAKTGFQTRINGVLAQILQKYPDDYHLKPLKVKEVSNEYGAATD
jgi:hypothetical protein